MNKKTLILLTGIVLFAILLRLAFFSGVGTSDSLWYSRIANDFSNKNFTLEPNHVSTRIGLLIPVSISYLIFGVNDFSSVIFSLLTSLGGIILIFFFGKLLFNEKVGLVAAFLLSFFPLNVLYSTRLLPDLPSAFFAGLSVFFFLTAEKISGKTKTYLLYILSGISLWWATAIKELALLTILFFVGYVVYNRRFKKSYTLVMVSFLFMLFMEISFFYAQTGDPLYRYHGLTGFYLDAASNQDFYGRLSFPKFFVTWPYVIFNDIQIGYFYMFISLTILYWIINRKKETNYMLIWFLTFLLYLFFGTSSITTYAPFLAVGRYLNYVAVPSLLLLAAFLMENKDIIKKVIFPFTLVFLFLTSFGAIYLDEYHNNLDDLKETYNYIKSFDKDIYTDQRSIKAINYISGYNTNLNLIDLDSDPENIKTIEDSYIIINNPMVMGLTDVGANLKFIAEIEQIPAKWVKIKEIGKYPKETIFIYYAK